MSRRLPVAHSEVKVGVTLDGHYGWFCKWCGAESRYTYATYLQANQRARRHSVTCKEVKS